MNFHFLLQRLAAASFAGRVSEAGKVLSKSSAAQVQAAIAALQKLLDASQPAETAATESAAPTVSPEFWEQLEEADMSHDEVRSAINKALRANRYRPDGSYIYRYIQDVYDSWFVYHESGTEDSSSLYKCEYSIGEDGKATLGEPAEVRIQIEYVEVESAGTQSESAQSLEFQPVTVSRLTEKAGSGSKKVRIKVIEPGWGSSAYYPKEVLARDASKAFPAGTKMFYNHPTPMEESEIPERDLTKFAAVLTSDAVFEESGADGPGAYADAEVFSDYSEKVTERAEHMGTSIYALGTTKHGEAEGRKGLILQELKADRFNTVDFVTEAGAGGKVLIEAARRHTPAQRLQEDAVPPAADSTTTDPAEGNQSQEDTTVTEAEIKAMQERLEKLEGENASLRETSGRTSEALVLMQARTFVAETLAPIEMPELTRARVAEKLAKAPKLTEAGELDREAYKTQIEEAAQAELDYLAKLAGDGAIVGMNSVTRESADPIDEADLDRQLEESFGGLGLDEAGAKVAATGRIR